LAGSVEPMVVGWSEDSIADCRADMGSSRHSQVVRVPAAKGHVTPSASSQAVETCRSSEQATDYGEEVVRRRS
jgi:hypothetical protein